METLAHAENFVKTLREAVGNRCDLLFGTHGQMTPAGAIWLAKRLEKHDPLWFEKPPRQTIPQKWAKLPE